MGDPPSGDQSPLNSFESEVELIGSAMYAPEAMGAAFDALRPEHFGDPVHSAIWQVIVEVARAGGAPVPAIIRDRLGNHPSFVEWGGLSMLAQLIEAAAPTTAATHVEAVLDRAGRRALLDLSRELAGRAADLASENVSSIVADAETALTAITETSAAEDGYVVDAPDAIDQTIDRMDLVAKHGKPRGLLTGLRCFDYRLRGLQPGWLVVVAGRPSMGKTALARSTAMAAALRNPSHRFVFFTVEMDREELMHRTLSELSYLEWGGIQATPYFDMLGVLDGDIRADLRSLRRPPNFTVVDAPAISVAYIRRKLHALKKRGPIGAVFIDYLQIMQRPAAAGRNEASVIAEMTTALKQLALELKVCIVLLSQLNRAVESRDDKVPQMSDLRESGSIEQDANAVLLCFREHYYLQKKEPKGSPTSPAYTEWLNKCDEVRRVLDVYVPKVRAGPTGRDSQTYFAEFDHVEDPKQSRVGSGGESE